MLEMTTNEVGSFNLCDGETLEFHLAMSDEPGVNAMDGTMFSSDNKVINVKLVEDSTEVAVSNVTDTVVRGHQHSLFYKYTNDTGMPITYTITVDADISDMTASFATIEPGNLQWGYRTYGAGYELETNPTSSVCMM